MGSGQQVNANVYLYFCCWPLLLQVSYAEALDGFPSMGSRLWILDSWFSILGSWFWLFGPGPRPRPIGFQHFAMPPTWSFGHENENKIWNTSPRVEKGSPRQRESIMLLYLDCPNTFDCTINNNPSRPLYYRRAWSLWEPINSHGQWYSQNSAIKEMKLSKLGPVTWWSWRC